MSQNDMNIRSRVVHDQMLQHRVDAPCDGLTAKAMGTYKLQEKLPAGLLVTFVSYQERDDKPAKPLADSERVPRGSILNFSVSLEQRLQHHKLLRRIYKERVLTVIAKYGARFLKAPVVDSVRDKLAEEKGDQDVQKPKPKLNSVGSQRAAQAVAALVAVQSSMSGVEFAAGLDSIYELNNGFQHINSDEQLSTDMKEMCDDGVVELLEADMPLECMIIKHHEIFLKLLR